MSARVNEALAELDARVRALGPGTGDEALQMATGLLWRATITVLGALDPEPPVIGRVSEQLLLLLLELREEVLKEKSIQ